MADSTAARDDEDGERNRAEPDYQGEVATRKGALHAPLPERRADLADRSVDVTSADAVWARVLADPARANPSGMRWPPPPPARKTLRNVPEEPVRLSRDKAARL